MAAIVSLILILSVVSQSAIDEWKGLRRFVGAYVVVRDTSGDIPGRLMNIADDSLTIDIGGDTRSVLRNRTCAISILERDRSSAIGWIVGLTLAGLGAGIIAAHTAEGANAAVFTAIGTGAGTLIGTAKTRKRRVYRSPSVPAGCPSQRDVR